MPVFNSPELLQSLQDDIKKLMAGTVMLKQLPAGTLNASPAPGKWSAIQVIEHLNSYNRYYLSTIADSLQHAHKYHLNTVFKPGWFGNYFTKMMQPNAQGKIANKMNAPKDHRPSPVLDAEKVFAEFEREQQKLLNYLQQAAKADIGKLRVPISISKWIKLKLGDTFRFLIAHQQRHFIQIDNILKALDVTVITQSRTA